MKIKYVEGDLFAAVAADEGNRIVIPHVCNNQGGWGSGFVVPLGRIYPVAQKSYLAWHKGVQYVTPEIVKVTGKFDLGQTQFIQVSAPDLFVANMVAQTVWMPWLSLPLMKMPELCVQCSVLVWLVVTGCLLKS